MIDQDTRIALSLVQSNPHLGGKRILPTVPTDSEIILDRLVERALLTRERDEYGYRYTLTPKGAQALEEAEAAVREAK